METIIDGQLIQIDDADAPLLAEHPWKVRPTGRSKAWRVVWYESFRHEDGKRGVSARQFHRELYPDHAGNISFADGNPFNLRRANLVLHTTVVSRLESPYSPAELAMLYQDHSIEWLCNDAAARLGKLGSVNEEAVRRWLAECGITPRTAAQEQARQYALDRPRRLEWQRKGRITHAARAAAGCYPDMAERMREGWRKAYAHKKLSQAMIKARQRDFTCPFSSPRLRELYWRQGKSLAEIGSMASVLIDALPIGQSVVTRWLREADITLRTAAESQGVRARLHPGQFPGNPANMAQFRSPEERQGWAKKAGARLKKAQKKGTKAAAAKKRAERSWETRECAYPWCRNVVTKPAKTFRHPPERTYCSKSCGAKHYHWRQKSGI